MKITPALCLSAIFAAAPLFAQEAQEPAGSAFGLTPAKQESILPPSSGELPLIPDNIPQTQKNSGTAIKDKPEKDKDKTPKTDKTAAADDALQLRIKMRIAKTKAARDPRVQEAWEQSLNSPTEFEKRDHLKIYYTRLCDGIVKADPSLKDEADKLKVAYVGRLRQDRMVPTEVPNGYTPEYKPAPAEAAAAGATPAPHKKHDKKKKQS